MVPGYLVFALIPFLCPEISTEKHFQHRIRKENNTDVTDHMLTPNQENEELNDNLLKEVLSTYQYPVVREGLMRSLRSFRESEGFASIKRELETLDRLENLKNFGYETPKKFNSDDDIELGDLSFSPIYNLKQGYQNKGEDRMVNNSKTVKTDSDFPSPVLTQEAVSKPEQSSKEFRPQSSYKVLKKSIGRAGIPENVCNIGQIDISISLREERSTGAGLHTLVCNGSVTVRKCEGACNSQVSPSVSNYDGFERECSCCKDRAARTRSIVLTMCTLDMREVHGYNITRHILEPRSCECQRCRT